MLMLKLCLHAVGGILQKFLVSGIKSVTRTKSMSVLKHCTGGQHQSDLEKSRAEEAAGYDLHNFKSREPMERTLK